MEREDMEMSAKVRILHTSVRAVERYKSYLVIKCVMLFVIRKIAGTRKRARGIPTYL